MSMTSHRSTKPRRVVTVSLFRNAVPLCCYLFLPILLHCRTTTAFLPLPSSNRRLYSPNVPINHPQKDKCTPPTSSSRLYMGRSVGKSGAKMISTEESFTEILSSSTKPVVLFFSAPWCGPCRLSNPVVKDVMKLYDKQVDVYEICTDDLPDVASGAGVVSIPTIQIYYEGALCDTVVGCVAKNVLANVVGKILEDIEGVG